LTYDIILADPPWRFASNSEAKPGKNAMQHYPCMRIPEIKALPVPDLAGRPALVFLWTTSPMLALSMDVLAAWRLKYVSHVIWLKNRIGTGYWVRGKHELLLIAKRGRFPCPSPTLFPESVIYAPITEHSRKPEVFQDRIDAAFPEARKLEMFARRVRPGWAAWGNETDRFAYEATAR
jgi:N6-adenosine-specific RNA methylase IME4